MTDPFGAILEQELAPLAAAADAWPARVNETTLLPWIDVYFKRLHPTVSVRRLPVALSAAGKLGIPHMRVNKTRVHEARMYEGRVNEGRVNKARANKTRVNEA